MTGKKNTYTVYRRDPKTGVMHETKLSLTEDEAAELFSEDNQPEQAELLPCPHCKTEPIPHLPSQRLESGLRFCRYCGIEVEPQIWNAMSRERAELRTILIDVGAASRAVHADTENAGKLATDAMNAAVRKGCELMDDDE